MSSKKQTKKVVEIKKSAEKSTKTENSTTNKDKLSGEILMRIGVQASVLAKYILDPKVNEGHIGLKQIIEMTNVVVANVKALTELDKESGEEA